MKKRILALVVALAAATACAPEESADEAPQVQDGVVVPGEQ
jgi:hypothetical protein